MTHYVAVTATGVPPVSAISGVGSARLGSPFSVDGSSSTSVEALSLEYSWRIAFRPTGSTVVAPQTEQAILTFVPDAVGRYEIELDVFDGELWSTTPAVAGVDATP